MKLIITAPFPFNERVLQSQDTAGLKLPSKEVNLLSPWAVLVSRSVQPDAARSVRELKSRFRKCKEKCTCLFSCIHNHAVSSDKKGPI